MVNQKALERKQTMGLVRYYMISFGHGTQMYLYKSTIEDLEVGNTVVVQAGKDGRKIGMIVNEMKSIPKNLLISEDKVKEVIHKNLRDIQEEEAKNYLLWLVVAFMDGVITRVEFAEIAEGFVTSNNLQLSKQSNIYKVVRDILPDMCMIYVDEPGNEDDKEFGFRKEIKKVYHELKYGDFRIEDIKGKVSNKILHDPVEDMEQYQRVELDVERKTKKELEGKERGIGFCHLYWWAKKRILKEDYNIDWKTPAEMNPDARFD